jgi:hypothetical protein
MQDSRDTYFSPTGLNSYGSNGPISGVNAINASQLRPQSLPQLIPPGLQSLYESCLKVYPLQPNPLQVTAVLKYWYLLTINS